MTVTLVTATSETINRARVIGGIYVVFPAEKSLGHDLGRWRGFQHQRRVAVGALSGCRRGGRAVCLPVCQDEVRSAKRAKLGEFSGPRDSHSSFLLVAVPGLCCHRSFQHGCHATVCTHRHFLSLGRVGRAGPVPHRGSSALVPELGFPAQQQPRWALPVWAGPTPCCGSARCWCQQSPGWAVQAP